MPRPAPLVRRARLVAVLGAGVLLASALAACSGDRPEIADESSTTTTTTEPSTTTTEAPPPGPEVAQSKGPSIGVYASEDATQPERQIVSGIDTSVDTIPIVFFVKARDPKADRLEVYLPVRPNGSSGWVDAADVTVRKMPYRIRVGLAAHRLQVLRDDEVILDEPVGVGRSEVPTPGGVYYVKELLQPPNPNGVYGTYAYGLSGFSNVLTSFNGGSGVIGIHGTNQPELVGTDVSHGCIRLRNEVIERMVEEIGLPLGTPVEIDQ
jgi:lipoprotein-anchoring transpeptidase ErfK/SrfK